MLDIAETVF
jgi:hypothetical protein